MLTLSLYIAEESIRRLKRLTLSASANGLPLEPGHAFSVEPGIYFAGRWGMRLEDIVVATEGGPQAVNLADHALVSVEA